MKVRAFLVLMTLFLVSSHSLSSVARSHLYIEQDLAVHEAQGIVDVKDEGMLLHMGGRHINARMDMEIADYEPAGPNPKHDPPPPTVGRNV